MNSELRIQISAIIGDVYARTYAASVAAGIDAEELAKQAVVDFLAVMRQVDSSIWGHYSLEA